MGEFTYGFGFRPKEYIAESITDLIGKTPMLKMSRYAAAAGVGGNILAKLEYFNPLGSSKDRIGIAMIEDAEKKELLKEGGVIIEPTSGNTGIALAFAAIVKGYRLILTMPENMSLERIKLLKALSAEIVLTPAEKGMQGAVDKAHELAAGYDNAYIPSQFENPANANIHKITTAQEILHDTYGGVDFFVAGVGTGGTLTGVGETLKAFNDRTKIIAVEPADSPLLTKGTAGPHKIQGIGANFIPSVLNRDIIDEVIDVTTEQSYNAARTAAQTEGVLVGISSGAALFAASVIASRPENTGKNIVVLLPDSGERYLSTDLFDF
ncbi:MAG: cysteine synthase A [Clostridiales bacterium]|nr:cysteine synthase A [Clostridiales bacterium]MCD7827351.1 cysteine synthase A [Clostridiales bacterium]